MPFAGDRLQAQSAVEALLSLRIAEGDELILADNLGVAGDIDGVRVIRVSGERSPAHARNAGAAQATGQWILFLDADCRAPSELIDAYFWEPVDARTGASSERFAHLKRSYD